MTGVGGDLRDNHPWATAVGTHPEAQRLRPVASEPAFLSHLTAYGAQRPAPRPPGTGVPPGDVPHAATAGGFAGGWRRGALSPEGHGRARDSGGQGPRGRARLPCGRYGSAPPPASPGSGAAAAPAGRPP